MMLEEIRMTAGDRRPILRVVFSVKNDPTTNPLQGAVGISFKLVSRTTRSMRFQSAGTIESVSNRIGSYSWGATDTTEKGKWNGFFIVDYGSGVVQTFPGDGDGIPFSFD